MALLITSTTTSSQSAAPDAGGEHVELADEAGGQRDAGQREQHGGEHGGQPGPAPEQAAVVLQGVGVPRLLRRSRLTTAERAEDGDE